MKKKAKRVMDVIKVVQRTVLPDLETLQVHNQDHFSKLLIAGLFVVSGVMVDHGTRQLNPRIKLLDLPSLLGIGLFSLGWYYVANLVASKLSDGSRQMVFLASGVIWGSALYIASQMRINGEVNQIALGTFMIGWFALGWLAGEHNESRRGLWASALVLCSILVALPWQRKRKLVDGPGYVLFTLAWVVLALVNSRIAL